MNRREKERERAAGGLTLSEGRLVRSARILTPRNGLMLFIFL